MTVAGEPGQKDDDQKQNHDRAHQTAGAGEGIKRIDGFQQLARANRLRIDNRIFGKERRADAQCDHPDRLNVKRQLKVNRSQNAAQRHR